MRHLLPLLLATPAAAQDRPPLFPTRDAAVTYRVTGAGSTGRDGDILRIAFLAAERRQRMDVQPNAWVIVDRAANVGIMVDEGSRTAMRLPLNPATMVRCEPTPDAAFTREGADRVANIPCTNWSYRTAESSGRLCITAEGVALRMETVFAGQPARAEATEVRIAPQDPSRFQVPAGYQVTEATPPRQRPPRR